MSEFQLPESLITAIQKNSLIPIVGAGVSMSIKDVKGNKVFPSWTQLLENAAEKLEKEQDINNSGLVRIFLNKGDFQNAAQYAYEGLKGKNWYEFIGDVFDINVDDINEHSAKLPRAIWGISNNLITLNYDKVLEWFHPQDSRAVKSININSSAEIAEFGNVISKPTVWHFHGSIEDRENLILTPDGYKHLYATGERTESQYEANLSKFKNISTSKNLIFIGCSLSDAELLAEIHKQHEIFAENTGPHFALVKEADISSVEAALKDTKIKLVTFKEYGKDLENLVSQIASFSQVNNVTELGSNKILEEHNEKEIDTKKTRIAVLIANPIDKPQNHNNLIKQIKKIKCECIELPLNIDALNNLDDYDYLIILSKTTQGKLIVENEFFASMRFSLKQLEAEINGDHLKGVFIFTDKLLDNTDLDELALPIAIYEVNEENPVNGIDHKLFRKLDLNSISKRLIFNEKNFELKVISETKKFVPNLAKLPQEIDQNNWGQSKIKFTTY